MNEKGRRIRHDLIPLSEAVKRNIRGGEILHFSISHMYPYALSGEIIRQFHRRDPNFTIVVLGAVLHPAVMVHLGIVRRLVTSYAGEVYPDPAPNPVFQRAFASRRVEFEFWSLLSLSERLLASALGYPFFPTRSLLGTDMERLLQGKVFRPPVELSGRGGGDWAMIPALEPDITILHALAADQEGNLYLPPPHAEGYLGALSSRRGVIATVEGLLEGEVPAELSPFMKVPSSRVLSVSVARFGAHPGGLYNRWFPGLPAYAEDYDFLLEYREAAKRGGASLEEWIDGWILDVGSHEGYLEKVGPERFQQLQEKAEPDSWKRDFERFREEMEGLSPPPPTDLERMIIKGGEIVAARVEGGGYGEVLAGQGVSNLSAWLGMMKARERGSKANLVAEVGLYGYTPRFMNPFIFNFANLPTAKSFSDPFYILSSLVGRGKGLGVLSGAQVDRFGNINSLKVQDFLIVGSGGANDVLSMAEEVILIIPCERLRFLPTLPFVMGKGDRVRFLVSTFGLLEKPAPGSEFHLTGYFPEDGLSEEERIRGIRSMCGWAPKVSPDLERFDPPDPEALFTLRAFDPKGFFTGWRKVEGP